MPKFGCTCGNGISDVVVPNEVTGSILSDKSEEKFFDRLIEVLDDFLAYSNSNQLDEWRKKHFGEGNPPNLPPSEMILDVLDSIYANVMLGVFECDQCQRLWVQTKVGVNRYRAYSPDEGRDESSKVLGLNEWKDEEK